MCTYFDFHTKDKVVDYQDDWIDYCESVSIEKDQEWFPFLSFPVTKRCNFHCLYCGVGGEATASNNDIISLELIKSYVYQAMEKGLRKFRITGGEPFLHPNIREILQFMGNLGAYVLVNTNGSLIVKNVEWLKDIPSTVKFAVSFDTMKPGVLKTISGVNCHDAIINGIKFLRNNGNLLRINMVINRHNYDEVFDIINFCKDIDCDLKILDVVSVPVPFSADRQDFYREVNTLEKEFSKTCDAVYSHEYTRGFGTPCYRYKFGNIFVTVKNSKKGSHYDIKGDESLCRKCQHYPCHEGLYDLFCLSDGRICACRWTEKQLYEDPFLQMDWLINVFKRAKYVYTGDNPNMKVREDLRK